MRTMKQQNGTPNNRNLSSVNRSYSGNKSKAKTPHKKWTNPQGKKFNKKEKPATRFDPNHPGQYVTKAAWFRMSDDERQSSRDARNTEGRRIRAYNQFHLRVTVLPYKPLWLP